MSEGKILQFSAGRTGSTLVFQCLREIFLDVEKIHKKEMQESYENSTFDCVITERDRVDSFLSRVRCMNSDGDEERFLRNIKDFKRLTKVALDYKAELDYVDKIKKEYKGRKLILRYGDFFDSHDFIFDEFELFFDIKLYYETRLDIKKKTDRYSNSQIQQRLGGSFRKVDKDSLIHGNHIWSKEDGYSKKILGEAEHKELESILT